MEVWYGDYIGGEHMNAEKILSLQTGGKTVQIFCSHKSAPLVVYHAVRGEGKKLWNACEKAGCPDFSLAVINGVNWDDEMTPWPISPISENDTPCTGGADAYLPRLTEEIMPQIVSVLPSAPEYCALAGYSLAGLFAVYAAYKTDCFSRLASGSGSLWYPEFVQFATKNRISEEISVAHFSLGDEESHTGNPYLDSVEDNTSYIVSLFSGKGIRTALYMNRGNHYQNQAERMASGIRWILEQNL